MNSPFKVMVEGAADPSKATASGPGIEPQGNQVGRRTFFNIFTTGMSVIIFEGLKFLHNFQSSLIFS